MAFLHPLMSFREANQGGGRVPGIIWISCWPVCKAVLSQDPGGRWSAELVRGWLSFSLWNTLQLQQFGEAWRQHGTGWHWEVCPASPVTPHHTRRQAALCGEYHSSQGAVRGGTANTEQGQRGRSCTQWCLLLLQHMRDPQAVRTWGSWPGEDQELCNERVTRPGKFRNQHHYGLDVRGALWYTPLLAQCHGRMTEVASFQSWS